MPIYEFRCDACGKEFETLVRRFDERPACPDCRSTAVTKLLSVPAPARSAGQRRLPITSREDAGPCGPDCCRLTGQPCCE